MSTPTAHLLALTTRLPWWLATSLMSLSVIIAAATAAAMLLPLWQRLSKAPEHQLRRYQRGLRLGWGGATLLALTIPYLLATTPWLAMLLLSAVSASVWLARVGLKQAHEEDHHAA
jgi:hypothetical protein